MFEKVLKRLCPCYYNRKNVKQDSSATSVALDKTSDFKERSTSFTSASTLLKSSTATTITHDSWKGTLHLVQPQPIYAFPVDTKKPAKRNQKNLLKPPLYWKKATKVLHSEGPPVFQEAKSVNAFHKFKKLKKKKNGKKSRLKHRETFADLSSVTCPSTVEVRWLRSQSLDNVFSETKKKVAGHKKDIKRRNHDGGKRERNKNAPCYLFSDISHGDIVFTAAYFNKKKTCMINIDRLENLSRKGREGNSYYSVIKIAVLPSEKYINCTKILDSCSNPEVKQDFSFSIKELNGKVLRFSVFDASLQKQHEAIGHALLTLEDIVCNQLKKYRIKLYRRSQPHICPGNLSLSLRYIENENKFTITVDKGRKLCLQKEGSVKLNTYVKAVLYCYGEKVKTKKSIVVLDSRNPNYNSTFTFQVRRSQIDHLSVAITIRVKGFVSDITLGRLNFGPFFYIDDENLTPWGKVFLKKEFVCCWFRMYL